MYNIAKTKARQVTDKIVSESQDDVDAGTMSNFCQRYSGHQDIGISILLVSPIVKIGEKRP